jgi:hypothetical protein
MGDGVVPEEKIRVSPQELIALLSNEDTDPEEIERYFKVRDDTPFGPQLELRENVEVEGLQAPEGLVGDAAIWIANKLARRARLARYERSLEENPTWPRIVSEGDSWFQHPMVKDTIDHLSASFSVLSLGAAGDELARMLGSTEFRRAIDTENPAAFLISGGGNDMLGDRFITYLHEEPQPGTDPARHLKDSFWTMLDQMIALYHGLFLELRWAYPELWVCCHGYDYAIPGEGKDGKWLGKAMRKRHITDEDEQKALVRVILDAFNDRLKEVAEGFDRVEYVECLESVAEDQWYDEIHPNREGFLQVALRFRNVLHTKLPPPN